MLKKKKLKLKFKIMFLKILQVFLKTRRDMINVVILDLKEKIKKLESEDN